MGRRKLGEAAGFLDKSFNWFQHDLDQCETDDESQNADDDDEPKDRCGRLLPAGHSVFCQSIGDDGCKNADPGKYERDNDI